MRPPILADGHHYLKVPYEERLVDPPAEGELDLVSGRPRGVKTLRSALTEGRPSPGLLDRRGTGSRQGKTSAELALRDSESQNACDARILAGFGIRDYTHQRMGP